MSTVSMNIPVPSSGFGFAVDVSSLVGEKTVVLSGRYRGAYVLYGSHDGTRFAPLLIFNAGGIEGIKQTFSGAFASVRLKSLAQGALGVSAGVSGLSVLADNSFSSLGLGDVLDLGNDLFQADLNFMGFGQVNGAVVVEGSLDGNGFNPIGEFASSGAGASLLGGGSGIEFSPVATKDRVRYVRLSVQGSAEAGFLVTVGGAQSEVGGGAETLAEAYAAGVTSVDQTMIVSHANGGKVVFDGTGLSAPDHETVEILGQSGYGALTMGPRNIGIGVAGFPPVDFNDPSSSLCVAMGFSHVNAGIQCVAIGVTSVSGDCTVAIGGGGCNAEGQSAIAIGHGASVSGGASSIALGDGAQVTGADGVALGTSSSVTGANGIAIGQAATAGTGQIVFSSGFSGGADLFEVVGSTPGNPDLFHFAVANLIGADTTSLTLLIKKRDGITIASVPVTIGLNDSGGLGFAVLRVANT